MVGSFDYAEGSWRLWHVVAIAAAGAVDRIALAARPDQIGRIAGLFWGFDRALLIGFALYVFTAACAAAHVRSQRRPA